LIVAIATFVAPSHAASEPLNAKVVGPDELVWSKGPTGNLRSVIAGDETKQGVYVFRGKFPAGFRNKPHYHPDDRIGMVISGTLHVGYGAIFDESKMKALSAGSIWTEPAGQPHFVWAKEGEVIIQIIGTGPSGTTLVESKQ
jgi:quercetin dioxygenase-like cupin family protein